MSKNIFYTILVLFFINTKSNNTSELEQELKNNFVRVSRLYKEINDFKLMSFSYKLDVIAEYKRLQKVISILSPERVKEIVKELKSK